MAMNKKRLNKPISDWDSCDNGCLTSCSMNFNCRLRSLTFIRKTTSLSKCNLSKQGLEIIPSEAHFSISALKTMMSCLTSKILEQPLISDCAHHATSNSTLYTATHCGGSSQFKACCWPCYHIQHLPVLNRKTVRVAVTDSFKHTFDLSQRTQLCRERLSPEITCFLSCCSTSGGKLLWERTCSCCSSSFTLPTRVMFSCSFWYSSDLSLSPSSVCAISVYDVPAIASATKTLQMSMFCEEF